MSSIKTFARWVDAQERAGVRFASLEEAAEKYDAREGVLSAIHAQRVASGSIAIKTDSPNPEADLELLARAIEHPKGEYFFLCYAPGPDGSDFVNMGLSGGERLVDVLKWYGLHGYLHAVEGFWQSVFRIIQRARVELAAELGRRAKQN